MAFRAISVVLVLASALADAASAHQLAFYALLGAVPAAAVAALDALGDVVEARAAAREGVLVQLRALLWGVALALIVVGATVRAAAGEEVPNVAASALLACLAVFGVQGALALVAQVWRPAGG